MMIDRHTSPQVLFDHVVRSLTAQRSRGVHKGVGRYRCPDGRRCAVGFLIDDDHYTSWLEGHSVRGLEAEGLLPPGLVWRVPLLVALERAHDVGMVAGSKPGDPWPSLVRRGFAPVADAFRLDMAVLPVSP